MPFTRPSLAEITARTQADLATRLGMGPLLPRGPLAVLARVLAGAAHLLYGFQEWISRQVLPTTAEGEQLERHASLYGLTRRDAVPAEGPMRIGGNDGATMPAGTRLRRAGGAEYLTLTAGTFSSGSATVNVRASSAGPAGNAPAGTALSLVSPVSGVRSPGLVVAPGLTGGRVAETDEELRVRVLDRVRHPPAGGNFEDYRAWALEVEGVTRAWVFPTFPAAGYVGITFTTDGAAGGSIPTPEKVLEVAAYIEERRPVTARPQVFAPVPLVLDVELHVTPDTDRVRLAVVDALEDLVLREAVPGGLLYLSHVREAISNAVGEVDHVLTLPTADVQAPPGELVQLGAVTFT